MRRPVVLTLGTNFFLVLASPHVRTALTNLRDAFISQSRSPNIVPFHMLGIVSYSAIVTLCLRRAVFTIFDFKNAVTLKTGLGSVKVIGNVTMRERI